MYRANTSGSCYLPRLTGGRETTLLSWGFCAFIRIFFWISQSCNNQPTNLWYPLFVINLIRKCFGIYHLTGFVNLSVFVLVFQFSYPQWTSCLIWSKWVVRWISRELTVGYRSKMYLFSWHCKVKHFKVLDSCK